MDRRRWHNRMLGRLGTAAMATLLGLGVLPGPASALAPSDGGPLTILPITIDDSSGDQYDPHVSGDIAAYTDGNSIQYYDFFSGLPGIVPTAVDAIDELSDVSNGQIAYARTEGDGRQPIMVHDTATNSSTEVDPQAFPLRTNAAIGSDTVAYIDNGFAGGELYASDIRLGGVTSRVTNDSRIDLQPQVAPLGDLVAYQSCASSSANCDVRQAGWSGSSWVVTNLTDNGEHEANPDTDGVIVVYDANRSGERDIYWQSVGGDSEKVLNLAGEQRNPSVSADIIAFESIAPLDTAADLYVYEVATTRMFRITSTPGNESLNDVYVLPGGKVRAVWAMGAVGARDVYGATFDVPLTVGPSYAFGGFLHPVDPLPALNSMKAGAAVPVKFSLGGNKGLDIFAAGYPKSQWIACDSTASVDGIEQTVTAGKSSLQYDALADVYTYIWKTDKAWSVSCRQLFLGFADGTFARANFRFN